MEFIKLKLGKFEINFYRFIMVLQAYIYKYVSFSCFQNHSHTKEYFLFNKKKRRKKSSSESDGTFEMKIAEMLAIRFFNDTHLVYADTRKHAYTIYGIATLVLYCVLSLTFR